MGKDMHTEMTKEFFDVRKFMAEHDWKCCWEQNVPWVGLLECWRRRGEVLILQAFTKCDGDNGKPNYTKIQGFTSYRENLDDNGRIADFKEMVK